MKNCMEICENIGAYIDGELNAQDRSAFEKHIDSCEMCSSELHEIMQVVELCNDISLEELPEDFRSQLHEKLVQVSEEKKQEKKIFSISRKPIRILSTVAACFIVLLFSYGLLNYPMINQSMEKQSKDGAPERAMTQMEGNEDTEKNMAVADSNSATKMEASDSMAMEFSEDIDKSTEEIVTVKEGSLAATEVPRMLKAPSFTITSEVNERGANSTTGKAVHNFVVIDETPDRKMEEIKKIALSNGAVFEPSVEIALSPSANEEPEADVTAKSAPDLEKDPSEDAGNTMEGNIAEGSLGDGKILGAGQYVEFNFLIPVDQFEIFKESLYQNLDESTIQLTVVEPKAQEKGASIEKQDTALEDTVQYTSVNIQISEQ